MQQEGGCPTKREKLGAKTDPSAYQPHVKLNCVPSDLLLSSCTLAGDQFLSVAIQQLHPHLFPPQTAHFLSVSLHQFSSHLHSRSADLHLYLNSDQPRSPTCTLLSALFPSAALLQLCAHCAGGEQLCSLPQEHFPPWVLSLSCLSLADTSRRTALSRQGQCVPLPHDGKQRQ